MKKILAIKVNDKDIILSDSNNLEVVYNLLDKEEDFILQWNDKERKVSEVIISNKFSSKVKNGDIKLSSIEKNKENIKC